MRVRDVERDGAGTAEWKLRASATLTRINSTASITPWPDRAASETSVKSLRCPAATRRLSLELRLREFAPPANGLTHFDPDFSSCRRFLISWAIWIGCLRHGS